MDLSCEFEGSTCLMGPSGAGKTSLLNALSGRAQHNIVRGYVTIDGAEPSSSVVQLTPQEDTLLAGLTVEQTFRYASLLYSDRDDAIERAVPRRCSGPQSKKAPRRRQRVSTGRDSREGKGNGSYWHRHARGKRCYAY